MSTKTLLSTLGTTAVALMVCTGSASARDMMDQSMTSSQGTQIEYESEKLIGAEVTNRQGAELGKVRNLAIGSDGKISYAVLGVGGVAGVGETELAVPWTQLEISPQQDKITLDVSKDRLKSEFSAFEEVRSSQARTQPQQQGQPMQRQEQPMQPGQSNQPMQQDQPMDPNPMN